MGKELAKAYEPHEVEERIYEFWMNGNYFHAEVDSKKKPYTIVIPPPNITGQLHMGHALDETLQDILIRFRRMQGYSALWLPGTDHASIATEAKIVEAMKQEGVTKEDIGRDGFMKRAWEWKEKYGGTIISQLKKLGSSCDWDRERFTLDEGCSKILFYICICHNWNFSANQWKNQHFTYQMLITLILRMYCYCGITQHSFRSGGC